MHMADALVIPAVAGTMYVASGIASTVSIKKLNTEFDSKKIPAMGVMGAFVFATQMINFTIPGTGSSGHLCGGLLLSAILGPYAGFLAMIGVLLTQCLFFADGGLMALGCNIWNMAFYGCFIGSLLFWKPIMKGGASKKKIIIASMLGSILTLQLGAFSVTLETLASGVTELPFRAFVMAMQPIHLAIGAVEGLITAAVLCFIYEVRPEMLWGITDEAEARWSKKKTIGILAAITAFIAGVLSLFASAFPDGLEWSIARIADVEPEGVGSIYEAAEKIQSATSFLPDYAFIGSDSAAGTSVSGIVGAAIVAVVCFAIASIVRHQRNVNNAETE